MPQLQTAQSVQNKQSCKICNSPSSTVICMHCFLNYNYKVYSCAEDEPLDATGLQPIKATAHEDDDYWSSERKRMEEDEEENEPHQPFSLSSIFARLPRFE